METFLDKKDVAARLGVSHRTVTRLIASGQLKALKVGAQVRVRPADLDRFVEQQAEAGV